MIFIFIPNINTFLSLLRRILSRIVSVIHDISRIIKSNGREQIMIGEGNKIRTHKATKQQQNASNFLFRFREHYSISRGTATKGHFFLHPSLFFSEILFLLRSAFLSDTTVIAGRNSALCSFEGSVDSKREEMALPRVT